MTAPGRKQELDILMTAMIDVSQGRGGAVVIEGEAAIGKTHFVRALCDAAGSHRLCVLEGRADEYDLDGRWPLWPMRCCSGRRPTATSARPVCWTTTRARSCWSTRSSRPSKPAPWSAGSPGAGAPPLGRSADDLGDRLYRVPAL
jgi:AAA ATPase domain